MGTLAWDTFRWSARRARHTGLRWEGPQLKRRRKSRAAERTSLSFLHLNVLPVVVYLRNKFGNEVLKMLHFLLK